MWDQVAGKHRDDVNLHNNHVNHWHLSQRHSLSLSLIFLCEHAFVDGLHPAVTQWDPQNTSSPYHLQVQRNALKGTQTGWSVFQDVLQQHWWDSDGWNADPRSVVSLCLHKTPLKPSSVRQLLFVRVTMMCRCLESGLPAFWFMNSWKKTYELYICLPGEWERERARKRSMQMVTQSAFGCRPYGIVSCLDRGQLLTGLLLAPLLSPCYFTLSVLAFILILNTFITLCCKSLHGKLFAGFVHNHQKYIQMKFSNVPLVQILKWWSSRMLLFVEIASHR